MSANAGIKTFPIIYEISFQQSTLKEKKIMSKNDQDIVNQIKSGNLSLEELQALFPESLTSNVSASDWGVCYSSVTGQLSQFATVTSNNSGDPITGVGMLAYTSNGSTLLCLQYTNNFSSPSIATSIGTGLYTPSMGNQALCVIYGWTEQSNYYLTQTLTIGAC